MARILVVNNYPTADRVERLRRSLEVHGAAVEGSAWREATGRLFSGFDGVVLSGSPFMLSEGWVRRKFSGEIEALRDTRAPVIGICFGHQLVACAFGSSILRLKRSTRRYVETQVLQRDPIFQGLPGEIEVFESHHEVVDEVPEDFTLLARSSRSPIAAMKHSGMTIYGLQFHPERSSKLRPDGDAVVANMVKGLS